MSGSGSCCLPTGAGKTFFRCLEKVRSRSGCRLFLEEEPSSPSSGQKAQLP